MGWIIATLVLAAVFIFLVGFEVGNRISNSLIEALKTEIRENIDRELSYMKMLRDYKDKLEYKTNELEQLRNEVAMIYGGRK